jgi:excisionase family DNA binding protein
MTTTASSVTTGAAGASAAGWLTLNEAAAVLGVHANTLRRWTDRDSIRSYRTIGGHRRLASDDVYRLAGVDAPTHATPTTAACLDRGASAVIETSLLGELSDGECRLRLRTYGRQAGTRARQAGQSPAEAIRSHLPIRREIGEVVARMRFTAGIGRSEVDEREWSDALADAFFLGLADSADIVRSRVRGGERRGDGAALRGRRGTPQ